MDAGFRRLRYCRYADDFLIGVIGEAMREGSCRSQDLPDRYWP